jgi:hypothetical protein
MMMKPEFRKMDKLLAAGAYARALGGDYTDRRRVTLVERPEVAGAIQSDAATGAILEHLHSMRGICVRAAVPSMSDDERASCQAEIDLLKGEITRLAESVPGADFLPGAIKDASPAVIDESVDKISRMAPAPGAATNDEKLADWMLSLLGGGRRPS